MNLNACIISYVAFQKRIIINKGTAQQFSTLWSHLTIKHHSKRFQSSSISSQILTLATVSSWLTYKSIYRVATKSPCMRLSFVNMFCFYQYKCQSHCLFDHASDMIVPRMCERSRGNSYPATRRCISTLCCPS